MNPAADNSRARIYSVVALIPEGSVSTYGRIAELAELPGHARQVGYALAALPNGNDVPWHRVVNAKGEISPRASGGGTGRQRRLLEAEGVEFDGGGRVSLARFGWRIRGSAA